MPAGGKAHFFLVKADHNQRRLFAAAVEAKLRSLNLMRNGMRIVVKKSLHLYVFDDHGLVTPGGRFVDNAVARRDVLVLSNEIELALADLFKHDLPGCPPFLWRYLKVSPITLPGSPDGLHMVSAKLVTGDVVDHWYVSYELKLQTPDGEVNGVHGAVMEMRFQPHRDGTLHLILLHIRMPLMGYSFSTRFDGIALPEVEIVAPRVAPDGHDLHRPTPSQPLELPDKKTLDLPPHLFTSAGPATGRDPAIKPRLAFTLPVEGSNILAPQMLLGRGETLRHFPITRDSARLQIDHKRQGGMDVLTAKPFPATYDDWQFVWHFTHISSTQRDNPNGRIASGAALVLPRGSYQIDVLARRRYTLPGSAGLGVDAVIRARRTIWASMEMTEVENEVAQQILAGHHKDDNRGADGGGAHAGHA